MKYATGDLLTLNSGVIVHQVNCAGIMGAGIARQIAQVYPYVEQKYIEYTRAHNGNCLGKVLITPASPNDTLFVANLFGQQHISFKEKATNYGALAYCLTQLLHPNLNDLDLYIPVNIGCGLGRGDWNVVKEIIEFFYTERIRNNALGSIILVDYKKDENVTITNSN